MDPPLSGLQKAAVLLISLGSEASIEVFKHLDPSEVAQLSAEISRLPHVSMSVAHSVMEECQNLAIAEGGSILGGLDYAKNDLEKVVGKERAEEIMGNLQESRPGTLNVVKRIDPRNLLNFTRREHPQTLALILAKLDPARAGKFLVELPPELQSEVVLRIANMDKTVPEVLEQIESVLEERLAMFSGPEVAMTGGVKAAAEILNQVSRAQEEKILEGLETVDEGLAQNIRNLMFTFQDLVLVDDRGIQRVLREVNQRELAMALKAASEEVKAKIFKNMSERAATMLKEEMEDMGPVRVREVEEVQVRIVTVVRALQEVGEIMVQGRGGDEEILI